MVPNEGFRAGIAKRSKVQRLAWAWKGAQQNIKERRLNPLQAVTEARQLAENLSDKIVGAGGRQEDLAVSIVFASADNLGKMAKEPEVLRAKDPHADSNDLEAARLNLRNVPIGFVVCVLDRTYGEFIVHKRPLILDKAALSLLDRYAEILANGVTDPREHD